MSSGQLWSGNLKEEKDLYFGDCCDRVFKNMRSHNKPVTNNWAILLKLSVPVLTFIFGSK
jgi:hypothetical protein